MIYYFLRPIVRIALIIYFRKIYINGLDRIPHDKPIIFVSNHPTAFIEPCMLACFLPMKLHFLVRGDLFSVGWLSWLLRGTNQIPIFRQKDGLDNVKKNAITQDKLFELFQEGGNLLMFPEAHTHENIYIKPLKKGVARFALMDHKTDLHIIPVGVNFDKNVLPNSKVMIEIGEPILINSFKNKEYSTEALRIKDVMETIIVGMKNTVRHINNFDIESNVHRVYRLNDLLNQNTIFPLVHLGKTKPFEEEKLIAKIIDNNSFKDEEAILTFDMSPIKEEKILHNPGFFQKILCIALSPILGVSLIINIFPIIICKSVVAAKINMHEFKSPVFLSLMILFYLIGFLVSFVLSILMGKKVLLVFLLLCILGILGNLYVKIYGKTLQWLLLPAHVKLKYKEIMAFVMSQNILQ